MAQVSTLGAGSRSEATAANRPVPTPAPRPQPTSVHPQDRAGISAEAREPEAVSSPVNLAWSRGAQASDSGPAGADWTKKLPPNLRKHGQDFLDAGKAHGVDPRFLAAISMQETGGGRSSAFRNKKNAMGIMGKGGVRRFPSVRDSIMAQARTLGRPDGPFAGRTTIPKIGQKYAPLGARNDPRGLNRHWVPNITRNFQSLGGDPSKPVIFR